MTKLYNHAFSLGFSIVSKHERGEDITDKMILSALLKRIQDCIVDDELQEAIDCPWDSYETDEESELKMLNHHAKDNFRRLLT